jgi:hypothetical protein
VEVAVVLVVLVVLVVVSELGVVVLVATDISLKSYRH